MHVHQVINDEKQADIHVLHFKIIIITHDLQCDKEKHA